MKTKFLAVVSEGYGEAGYVGIGDTPVEAIDKLREEYHTATGDEMSLESLILYESCRYGKAKITIEIIGE